MEASDSLRARRVDEEVRLLQGWFERVEYDAAGRNWVLVYDVPLPAGFNRPSTHALLLIPAEYPEVPPDGLFVDKGLNLPEHYVQQQSHNNPFGNKSWAWLCAHFDGNSWRPAADVGSGDNLVTLMGLYTTIFHEIRKQGK